MSYTTEQQEAIGARGQVIVSASAGAGKTFVMIERLVSLILDGTDVSSVLAVTFTEKAATQMRDRLRSALLGAIGSTSGEKREYLKAQLNSLPLADITTIDGFCARLVRTYFYAAEVDPAFRIVPEDDAEGKVLIARAMDLAFEKGYDEGDGEFHRLLSVWFYKKKDQELRTIVGKLYHKIRVLADYRNILSRMGEDVFAEAAKIVAEDILERATDIFDAAQVAALDSVSTGFGGEQVCKEIIAAVTPLLAEHDLYKMKELPVPKISSVRGQKDAEGDKKVHLGRVSSLASAARALYSGLAALQSEAVERARCEDAQKRAGALGKLLLSFDDCYSALKQEAGALDYSDLEHFALKVLSNADVRASLHEKYRYVFVDEYQDVNPAQEKLLSLLSGDEVFLVGDGKQAIYGFRGSRSKYFYDKTETIEHKKLSTNFRSADEVLRAVNQIFHPIVPNYKPMTGSGRYGAYKGGVEFHLVPDRAEPQEERELGIYSVLTGNRGREIDATAASVREIILKELGTEWFDVDANGKKGEFRRVGYGDIAVLVRYKKGAPERIVQALSDMGIPVTTSVKVDLMNYFEARLIIDVLSYLDNAEQDIPMAATMLSAIGGFTDADLAHIRVCFPTPYTFRAACKQYMWKTDDPLARRLKEFYRLIDALRAQARVKTAQEMLGLLLSMGLEAQIAAKVGDARASLARVRRIVAESEGSANIHAFLARLKSPDRQILFAESGGENAVRVETIHSSKGLEYPVVILVGMDTAFHGDNKKEVKWTERLLAAPLYFDLETRTYHETLIQAATDLIAREQSVEEERNLLYVAMTRARCRLHLFFKDGKHNYDPRRANHFSDFVDLNACAEYITPCVVTADEVLPRKTLDYDADETLKEQILSVYQKPYVFAESTRVPVKSSATAILHTKSEFVTPHAHFEEKEGESSVEAGLAYHAFLENVNFGADAGEELARMRRDKVLDEEQLALLDEEQLKKILSLPCFASFAGRRTWREKTFLVTLPAREALGGTAEDEVVFQGAIDLLVEGENGFEIIDYKYSVREDAALAEHYAPQIALYRKAVSKGMRVDENTVRARIVNIYKCREIPM